MTWQRGDQSSSPASASTSRREPFPPAPVCSFIIQGEVGSVFPRMLWPRDLGFHTPQLVTDTGRR